MIRREFLRIAAGLATFGAAGITAKEAIANTIAANQSGPPADGGFLVPADMQEFIAAWYDELLMTGDLIIEKRRKMGRICLELPRKHAKTTVFQFPAKMVQSTWRHDGKNRLQGEILLKLMSSTRGRRRAGPRRRY